MAQATRNVDVSVNGVTTQVPLIVDKNAQNQEAMGRAIVLNGALVDSTNPLPIANAVIGSQTDTAATTDTGTFSLVALFKRLLGRLPALVSGRIPVDGSSVIQPISASSLPLPAGASTEASVAALATRLPSTLVNGRLIVETVVSANSVFANYATSTRLGSSVLKTTAGRIVAVESDGTSLASAIYIQVFDTTTIPAASTRCQRFFPVLPGTLLFLDDLEMAFLAGLAVCVSSTRDTYTPVSDLTNIYFTVTYR